MTSLQSSSAAKVTRVGFTQNFENEVLRERAIRAHGGRSIEFVASRAGEEVGFLSYEDWPERAEGFISEIFVLDEFRQQGIGKLLLQFIEEHAYEQGRRALRLKPFALDLVPTTDSLIRWYSKSGYVNCALVNDVLEKMLGNEVRQRAFMSG